MLPDEIGTVDGVRVTTPERAAFDGGAESPPESHTRMVLAEAGLPRPETQIAIERTAILESLGWTVIRVGDQLLYDRPQELVRRVRAKLTDERVVTGTNAERRSR